MHFEYQSYGKQSSPRFSPSTITKGFRARGEIPQGYRHADFAVLI